MSQRSLNPTSALPSKDRCVLPAMLDRLAAAHGDKLFVLFDPEGDSWSYSQTQREGRLTASALHRLGVRRNDNVLVWLPNSPEILRVHIGLSYLGARFVGVNLAYRGASLEHIIRDSGATLLICHIDLLNRIESDLDTADLNTIVVVGGTGTCSKPIAIHSEDALRAEEDNFPAPTPEIEPWDVHAIVYTSGTTGPSKGVTCTHVHTLVHGQTSLQCCDSSDRFLLNLAYLHMAGPLVTFGALAIEGSFVMQREFRTSTFWDDVRRTGSTCTFLMGSMSTFLLKQPPTADDKNHPLRTVWQQPLLQDYREFSKRFGVSLFTQIDMTETAGSIVFGPLSHDEPMKTGFVGRLRTSWPRYEVRLLDENDQEVGVGEVGELAVRCDVPWVITPGYHNRPDATAAAWRNGWFHTGDALRQDADGNYYFVDRKKDSIRRRGENISSAELEAEILKHEVVSDVSAVSVRNGLEDEEVLVVMSLKPGTTLDFVSFTNYLVQKVPHFMVPRYMRIVDTLPYSETKKVQKAKLREQGVTPDTWDRERAGIIVKRESIGKKS